MSYIVAEQTGPFSLRLIDPVPSEDNSATLKPRITRLRKQLPDAEAKLKALEEKSPKATK